MTRQQVEELIAKYGLVPLYQRGYPCEDCFLFNQSICAVDQSCGDLFNNASEAYCLDNKLKSTPKGNRRI